MNTDCSSIHGCEIQLIAIGITNGDRCGKHSDCWLWVVNAKREREREMMEEKEEKYYAVVVEHE